MIYIIKIRIYVKNKKIIIKIAIYEFFYSKKSLKKYNYLLF